MQYPFRNLVFEGRGPQITSYIGAIEVLEEKGITENIDRVCGTSFGSLIALLVGLNYTFEECARILMKLNMNMAFRGSLKPERDQNRLLNHFGWHPNEDLRDFVAGLINKKTKSPNTTFYDLKKKTPMQKYRDMYFIGTNVTTHFSEVFSHETTPRICLADAVCISMSIPLIYQPARSLRDDPYIDGGILESLPIRLFDREKYIGTQKMKMHGLKTVYYEEGNKYLLQRKRSFSPYIYNKETLSFRLGTSIELDPFRDQSEPAHTRIDDFYDFTVSLINVMIKAQQNRHLNSDDWQRTIFINTYSVGALDFDLSESFKRKLVQSGRSGTYSYFNWYDDPKSHPVNRV